MPTAAETISAHSLASMTTPHPSTRLTSHLPAPSDSLPKESITRSGEQSEATIKLGQPPDAASHRAMGSAGFGYGIVTSSSNKVSEEQVGACGTGRGTCRNVVSHWWQ